ncbi:MAG: hypothetical protein C0618_01575 [Desulfuromonas sp.]|nr:MAG: hypothetical protein C0618_01575 [Desulfuromonas sp.]
MLVVDRRTGYNRCDMRNAPLSTSNRLPRLLLLTLALSTLLHLLAFWLLPTDSARDRLPHQKPTFVSLKEMPTTDTPQQGDWELDEKPLPSDTPPPETHRRAENNQQVEQEMAPRGEDSRDQTSTITASTPASTLSQSQPEPPSRDTVPGKKVIRPDLTSTYDSKQEDRPKTEPTPSLNQLTRLSPDLQQKLASQNGAQRIKSRPDVLEGDEIYLNLKHDVLLSFFRRFSGRIESMWNYPDRAAQKGEQGVLLLKITISRDGDLIDVDLIEESGSEALDIEAIQAVYRAAPFGPVTKHWPHEQMKIYAHFQYKLSNRFIFGRE